MLPPRLGGRGGTYDQPLRDDGCSVTPCCGTGVEPPLHRCRISGRRSQLAGQSGR